MSSVSSTSSASSYYYAMQKKMFEKLDADQDGALDRDEVLSGKPKNMSKDQASKLYDVLDTNKSGTLSMDEFAAGTSPTAAGAGLLGTLSSDALDVLMQLQQQGGMMSGGGNQSASDAAYDALDTNKDGVVSEEEFLAAHPDSLTDNEAKKLFETLDSDKDGTVSKDQFKTITDATTPPRLMGPSYFGLDPQTGESTSDASGLASLFGSVAGKPNSALHLFDLLATESESASGGSI